MDTVLAVDLGGTKTASAAIDEWGGIASKVKEPAAHSLESTVNQIAQAVERTNASVIGIILPGIYTRQTGVAWAPNLWGRDEVPLRDLLASRLSIPAVIESDRSGYVLGEQWLGAARGLGDVVFLAVGTGIGVGILSGGRLITGAHGISGAAGWFALDPRWKDEYAQVGCWEAESAGPALARHAGMPSAEAVVGAARGGDPRAQAALDSAADYLGMGIANVISLLNPEMVVLGGGLMQGLAQAGDLLLERIRTGVARWAQPIAAGKAAIELTTLGEDAGLLGAARLAFLHTGTHKE
ncbi:MAG: ROK family protein [Acidobacteriia bacterium]|nr:ROK family protein [Terriglobia bacterium]